MYKKLKPKGFFLCYNFAQGQFFLKVNKLKENIFEISKGKLLVSMLIAQEISKSKEKDF